MQKSEQGSDVICEERQLLQKLIQSSFIYSRKDGRTISEMSVRRLESSFVESKNDRIMNT